MSANRHTRLSESQIPALGAAWSAAETELEDGWVVAGVMRRSDAPFMIDMDHDVYVAIAVSESAAQQLGPVPEVRGGGETPVAALFNLRLALKRRREEFSGVVGGGEAEP